MENELEARLVKRIKELEAKLLASDRQLRHLIAQTTKPNVKNYLNKPGLIDHGTLAGLADNDHLRYLGTWVNMVVLTTDNVNPSTIRTWETWEAI